VLRRNPARSGATAGVKEYFYTSRSVVYGFVLVLPLLVIYEVLALTLQKTHIVEFRNGADMLLRRLLEYVGVHGVFAVSAILVGGILAFSVTLAVRRRRRLRFKYFGLMVIESAILALVFGLILGRIPALVVQGAPDVPNVGVAAMLSIGAGVYEELLFRFVLLTGILLVLVRVFRFPLTPSFLLATVLSAAAFACFHYWSPNGETFAARSFLFRFLAGTAFGVLYVLRGFGVAAYTHAFYDLYLLVV
jgi:hypothetical protein